MKPGRSIAVEVAYAHPGGAFVRRVQIPEPATVRSAIEASGVLQWHPEIDLARNRVGIWSRLAGPDAAVEEGDRVEIYRPLVADPKDARRARINSPRRTVGQKSRG
ncbi:MAG: RnfH family protein [Burkholderiales bacterium]|jgi:hypothetical protein|nr:RnfH family protein [Burkholderiales bacterium]